MEDNDVHAALLKLQRLTDGRLAAVARALWVPLVTTGAHALNEDGGLDLPPLERRCAITLHEVLDLGVRYHLRGQAGPEVTGLRSVEVCADRQDDGAHGERLGRDPTARIRITGSSLGVRRSDGRLEVPDETRHALEDRAGPHVGARAVKRLDLLIDERLPAAPTRIRSREVDDAAAERVPSFDQMDREAPPREIDGRLYARDAAAYYEDLVAHLEFLLRERLQQPGPGHCHADEVAGLFRGRDRLLRVHPRALVADVDHLDQVRVQADRSRCLAEDRLVCLRRARSDDDSIQVVLDDAVLYLALRALGAGEEQILGERDVWKRVSVLRELRDVEYAADVDTAVADEDAHAGRARNISLLDVLLHHVEFVLENV